MLFSTFVVVILKFLNMLLSVSEVSSCSCSRPLKLDRVKIDLCAACHVCTLQVYALTKLNRLCTSGSDQGVQHKFYIKADRDLFQGIQIQR